MEPQPSELPSDVAACHAMIRELQEEVARLRRDVDLLRRQLFGSRRERFLEPKSEPEAAEATGEPIQETPPAAASEPSATAAETAAPAASSSRPPRTSQGRGARQFPPGIPRERVEHRLDEQSIAEELRNHPRAKRFFHLVREELEVRQPSVRVLEHYQEVIVLEDEAGETEVRTASVPPPLLIQCYAGVSLLAHLTTSRFADHLPYYRIEDILGRAGFRIHRATQWRWMRGVADLARPLVRRMRQRIVQSHVLGIDETPVRLIRLDLHGTRKAYLWALYGDAGQPYIGYHFTATREQEGPREFLRLFQGYLQSDAYICYELIAEDSEGRILAAACWSHARRKYEALYRLGPHPQAEWALAMIQRLSDIEDRARCLSDADRLALRQLEARPIVEEFKRWLDERHEQELPKSPLRAAINYQRNRWPAFERYLEDGAIPFDNNRTEAALKGPVVGRKNWLYFGNERAGETAAILFSLTMTCKRHCIDVQAYLEDILPRLARATPEELDELLPDRWIERHPEARVQQRVQESQAAAQRKRERRLRRRLAVADG